MKAKILLLILFLITNLACYSTTWQITTVSGQFAFSPASLTISEGDDVNFILSGIHDAVEVSQTTWQANGVTPIGGFSVPFGGGLVPASELTVGTHYYVCTNHASLGMKGMIIVENLTGISEVKKEAVMSVYPNPATKFIYIVFGESGSSPLSYDLIDLTGKIVMTGKSNERTTLVDINALPPGIYIVRIAGVHNYIKLEKK